MTTANEKPTHPRVNKPGYAACLGCGRQISYCGQPFTLDITCPSCGAVNVYEDSQRPVRIKHGAESALSELKPDA